MGLDRMELTSPGLIGLARVPVTLVWFRPAITLRCRDE
jgi:hypothetical protein